MEHRKTRQLTTHSLEQPNVRIRFVLIMIQYGCKKDSSTSELEECHPLPEAHPRGAGVACIVDQEFGRITCFHQYCLC